MEKILKLPFGEMPGAGFVMMAANDQFQHGWELAKATGQATNLDPELAGQLLGFVRAAIPDAPPPRPNHPHNTVRDRACLAGVATGLLQFDPTARIGGRSERPCSSFAVLSTS